MVPFHLLQWLSHGNQMTADIMGAVLRVVQKRLHWLLILNHLHCSFFLLKLYIQVYYSVPDKEHLTAWYWDSSKAVLEYLEIQISALLVRNQNVTLPRLDAHRDWAQLPRGRNGCVGGSMSLAHWREQELSVEEEEIAIFSFLFFSFSTARLTCDETYAFHS